MTQVGQAIIYSGVYKISIHLVHQNTIEYIITIYQITQVGALYNGFYPPHIPPAPEKLNPHPGEDISHAPIEYIRPTAIYTYIKCKTTHKSLLIGHSRATYKYCY